MLPALALPFFDEFGESPVQRPAHEGIPAGRQPRGQKRVRNGLKRIDLGIGNKKGSFRIGNPDFTGIASIRENSSRESLNRNLIEFFPAARVENL